MEALAYLFQRYARLVHSISCRILRDRAEADDLLQEVFLFIYRKGKIFNSSKSSVRSWIVQMTYHRAIDQRRYLHSRHFYTRVDLNGAGDLLDPRSQGKEEDAPFGSWAGNTAIQGLLETLTEDQRNTLSLHFFEGYTFDEIAVKLDQSLGNIRNHYYRGLDKLRTTYKVPFDRAITGVPTTPMAGLISVVFTSSKDTYVSPRPSSETRHKWPSAGLLPSASNA